MVEKRPDRQVPVPDKVLQRNRRMFGALLGHLDGAECVLRRRLFVLTAAET